MTNPTDPLFAQQWYLTSPVGGINVLPVWNDYTGAGVKIALFDTGVDFSHPDLNASISVALSMNAHTNVVGAGNGAPATPSDKHVRQPPA